MGTETPLSESHSRQQSGLWGPFTWQSVEERGRTFAEGRRSTKTRQGKPPLFLEADSWPFTSLGQCRCFTELQEQWVMIQPASGYLGMTSVLLMFNQVERLM